MDKTPVVFILLPAAKVLHELSRIVRTACDLRARAWMQEVFLDASAEQIELALSQHLAQANGTVTLVVSNLLWGHRPLHPRPINFASRWCGCERGSIATLLPRRQENAPSNRHPLHLFSLAIVLATARRCSTLNNSRSRRGASIRVRENRASNNFGA